MSTKPQQNQSPNEYLVQIKTGKDGLEQMLEAPKVKDEFSQIAHPSLRKELSIWTKRALSLISSDDNLKTVLQTKEGVYSIYTCLQKCLTMGLQVGGQFPHAYFVPKQGKATFVPTVEGLNFCAAYSQGAVLEYAPELVEIHKNDKISINKAESTYELEFDPFGGRGEVVGWLMVLQYRDGHKEIDFITMKDVLHIKEKYSSVKKSDGSLMPAWAKSEADMLRKIAAKKLLKRPAAQSNGLSMLMTQLEENEDLEPRQKYEQKPLQERVSDRLDKATESLGEGQGIPVDYSVEPEKQEPIKETKNELF